MANDGAAVRHNGAGGEVAPCPDLPAFVPERAGMAVGSTRLRKVVFDPELAGLM